MRKNRNGEIKNEEGFNVVSVKKHRIQASQQPLNLHGCNVMIIQK